MDVQDFWAKSAPKETVQEHTQQLLKRYDRLRERYESRLPVMSERDWELLRIAVQYHDVGKYDLMFQNKIRRALKMEQLEVNCEWETRHNYVSALAIPIKQLKLTDDEARVLLQAVGYHHERLTPLDNKEISKVKQVYESNVLPYRNRIKEELDIEIEDKPRVTTLYKLEQGKRILYEEGELFLRYVMIKGLLHRLDHAASAHVDVELAIDMNVMDNVNEYMNRKYNGKKRELQLYAEQHQDKHLVVMAQTGMGKTEAGLLWVGAEKGYFTLPLRVSLNAMYKRVTDADGIHFSRRIDDGEEATGLLHSSSIEVLEEYYEGNDEALEKVYAQSRQFANKLIVSTIDQILKFPFYYLGFEKEMASMAGNKIIIDELQAYNPHIAALIIRALTLIDELGGSFMIMTATLPDIYLKALQRRMIGSNREMLVHSFIDDSIQRHHVEVSPQSIGDEESILEMIRSGQNRKVLVICNTIKRAKEVFLKLKAFEQIKVSLLHAKFTNRDRDRLERELEAFEKNPDVTGIWVTTQLVEASLDIDFDRLFTEMSPLDSQFQRYGRCNRKGQKEKAVDEINVTVYTNQVSGIGKRSVYDPEIYAKSLSLMHTYLAEPRVLLESDKSQMVAALYDEAALEGTEYKQVFDDTLRELEDMIAYKMNSKKAQELLRNIREVQAIPYRYAGEPEIENAIHDWKTAKTSSQRRKARSRLERYAVGVNPYAAKGCLMEFPLIKQLYYVDAKYDEAVGIDLSTFPLDFY